MIKSDFDFEIVKMQGRYILKIVDLDLGRMSVTNDIENVVEYIFRKTPDVDPAGFLIIYQDSEHRWDGWDAKDRQFVALDEQTFEEAVTRYIKILNVGK
jgi:hypothetical protein